MYRTRVERDDATQYGHALVTRRHDRREPDQRIDVFGIPFEHAMDERSGAIFEPGLWVARLPVARCDQIDARNRGSNVEVRRCLERAQPRAAGLGRRIAL